MSSIIKKVINFEKINIKNIISKTSKVEKSSFITTICLGLITHMFMFVNVLPNWDSMYNFKSNNIWLQMGRWFLGQSMEISSSFDLPWIIGLLSIFFLGIASAIVVNVLEVKKISTAITISAIIVTFPALTSTFSYLFLADGYMLGILLASLAVLITQKYNKGYYIAGIILAFSLGIYQTNISFAVLLSLLIIVMNLLNPSKDIIDNIKYAMRFVIMSLIGLIIYFVTLKILTKIAGQGIASYQGGNEGFAINIQTILNILTEFKSCFTIITGGSNKFLIFLVLILFLCLFIMLVHIIILNKIYKNVWKMILIVISLAAIPFITGFAYFISNNTIYHMVMRMSWSLLFVAIILLVEKISLRKSINTFIKQVFFYFPTIITWVIIWNFMLVANISYINMYQRYEKEYALALRLVDRIEMNDEYTESIPVLFLGTPYTHKTENIYNNNIKYITGADGNVILVNDFHFKQFIKYYLGVDLSYANGDQVDKVMNSPEITKIKSFPNKNCVQVIDGVMVVKLSDIY